MIKLTVLLLAISAVYLEEFNPLDASHICVAYSSNADDKYAEREDSHLLYKTLDNYNAVDKKKEYIIHQGRCGHIYCSDEYACICNNGNVYFNVCHMRSLGVIKGHSCSCPPVESETIIKNSHAKSHKPIKEYHAAKRNAKAENQ